MIRQHLVAVWNPSYAADALEEHLRVLLDWSARAAAGKADRDEDVYVWWARLRSKHRTGGLPHLNDVLALNEQIEEHETHLYLTDYRSLYVGHIGEIRSEDVRELDGELEHLPPYYHDKLADLYFQLWDIRRLVADDTVATVSELAKLSNTRYHDMPVSMYGGMVDLPLIVTRADERLWFSDDGALTGDKLWAEHDGQYRGETEAMGRDLRENLLGDDVWALLEPGTRSFLASGEAIFRARRNDPGFDYSTVAIEYAKALETELNGIVFGALKRVYAKGNAVGRHTRIGEAAVDLGTAVQHMSLGTIRVALEKNPEVRKGLRIAYNDLDAEFLTQLLPSQLEDVAELRNPAAHRARIAREEVIAQRAEILGIGREGLISQLARIKARGRRP